MNFKRPLVFASVAVCSAVDSWQHGLGAHFLQSAAIHPASGDMLLLADPGDGAKKPVSIAVIPSGTPPGSNFWAMPAADNGSAVTYPTDLAFVGDSAFIVDQGDEGIAVFNRSSSGQWKFWKKWLLKGLLPDCDDQQRQFAQPEAIAAGSDGTLYVSVSVQQMGRCVLHPFKRCCESKGSSTAVMRLEISSDGSASFKEVFHSGSFFKLDDGKDLHYHIRGIDVTDDGDILVVGYGDDGMYFGQTAWLWNVSQSTAQRFAGRFQGEGGEGGDGGEATDALLDLPWGVVALPNAVYISEAGNYDIREIVGGRISTLVRENDSAYDFQSCRKLHRGRSSRSLLLAVSGIGENSGHVMEIGLDRKDSVVLV